MPTQADEHSDKSLHRFGHAGLCQSLCQRIAQHVQGAAHSPIDPGLTVGIMGAWGSGKSQLLQHILEHFAQPRSSIHDTLVIPVWFNAWRYEKDPNLIAPLLQTLHLELQQHCVLNNQASASHSAGQPSIWQKLKNISTVVLQYAKTFAAMGSAELSVTIDQADVVKKLIALAGLPDEALLKGNVKAQLTVKLNPRDGLQNHIQNSSTSSEAAENAATIYPFQQNLQKLMQASQDIPALYFLFLIDDLDRCLPEKALEMLETIKLFFNIAACGFVVALDDDVIERGVQHRYRDYLFNQTTEKENSATATTTILPITGAEYLEKIIQIPVRLSQPTQKESAAFLRQCFPELFDYQKENEAAAQLATAPANTQNQQHQDRSAEKGTNSIQQQVQNLQTTAQLKFDRCLLFVRAIPPQPRKLQRAAEVLSLATANLSPDTPARHMLLARLVIWELFAPALYRFCHRNPSRFGDVANWHHMANQHSADRAWLCGQIQALDPQGLIHQSLDSVKGHERQRAMHLRNLIVSCHQQRNEFDLGALFPQAHFASDQITS